MKILKNKLNIIISKSVLSVARADVEAAMAKSNSVEIITAMVASDRQLLSEEISKRNNLARMFDGTALKDFQSELLVLRQQNRALIDAVETLTNYNRLLDEALEKLKEFTDEESKRKTEAHDALKSAYEQLKTEYDQLKGDCDKKYQKLQEEMSRQQDSQLTLAELLAVRELLKRSSCSQHN